ncbi:agamous-like MADS-box protein AGL29 [Senna tora]|uniref:Agamous-like MADS-box protein AGL29 n=1 Tax=Senna tora TaxID=362788 RepID=A0A834XED9_9FABA|nr:agamous-like MADS-box protein AGL29 [Senna tora]
MKFVKDSSSRQVTFSKRRTGVFKKANELATLCGAQVAIVAFSPGGKPFSFGQPSVDDVTNKFLHNSTKSSNNNNNGGSFDGVIMEKLNQKFMDLMSEVQVEKKKGKMLDKSLKKKKLAWEGMDLNELKKLSGSLKRLEEDVQEYIKQLEASLSLILLAEKVVYAKSICIE